MLQVCQEFVIKCPRSILFKIIPSSQPSNEENQKIDKTVLRRISSGGLRVLNANDTLFDGNRIN